MKQIQEALSTPIDAATDFDEDELEAELEDLEGVELEEQLLQPTTRAPAALVHVPAGCNPLALCLQSPLPRKMNWQLCRLRWHFEQVYFLSCDTIDLCYLFINLF
ncbi:hypothetical protein JHK82_042972 [Glycine max]|uniref:Vacuolar protein sorting-associated protein 32 like 2 n=1 Tax=Glycine soja TaxID=3848 RepID=A0A0B2P635_GLYSO|nr:hypothetical protein JHK86_042989 [Glycine max]KAG4949751.1 hypothetical protein JHK86_042990 [Glycine max]KAG5106002.1 hypothetical protein JHK82_042972 [Glycine max]KHN03102.1 Vacuolar protein sorting-associated protein 32 like 2 [Glycine soja]RZB65414.1 hypothetical protein D0Y65_041463 [Glycine soja]